MRPVINRYPPLVGELGFKGRERRAIMVMHISLLLCLYARPKGLLRYKASHSAPRAQSLLPGLSRTFPRPGPRP